MKMTCSSVIEQSAGEGLILSLSNFQEVVVRTSKIKVQNMGRQIA